MTDGKGGGQRKKPFPAPGRVPWGHGEEGGVRRQAFCRAGRAANTDIGLGRQGADPRRPVMGCVLSLPSPSAGEVGIVPCDGYRPPRLTPRRV